MAKKVNDLCGMLLDLSLGNTLAVFLDKEKSEQRLMPKVKLYADVMKEGFFFIYIYIFKDG